MSGRKIEKHRFSNSKKKYGLVTRLASHASGRLSGDQFCVYVANRLVIPDLKQVDLEAFRGGNQTLDALTKKYIHQNFEYQYCLLESSQEAYSLEAQCRRGDVFGTVPLLNPLE